MAKKIEILSPVTGKVKELSKVDDPVFSEGMVGKGFAVTPDQKETKMTSPVSKGNVTIAFDGGHAYGIVTKKIELLIHIGIDTVGLKGKGFSQKAFVGTKLKKDSVLTEVDLKIIKKEAKSTDTMVLVTNESLGDYRIERVAGETVKAGEVLFNLVN